MEAKKFSGEIKSEFALQATACRPEEAAALGRAGVKAYLANNNSEGAQCIQNIIDLFEPANDSKALRTALVATHRPEDNSLNSGADGISILGAAIICRDKLFFESTDVSRLQHVFTEAEIPYLGMYAIDEGFVPAARAFAELIACQNTRKSSLMSNINGSHARFVVKALHHSAPMAAAVFGVLRNSIGHTHYELEGKLAPYDNRLQALRAAWNIYPKPPDSLI